MRRIAADDSPQRDDGIVTAAVGKLAHRERQLERTGHTYDREVMRARAVLDERVDCSGAQAFDDRLVVTCGDECNAQLARIGFAFDELQVRSRDRRAH